MKKYHLLTGLYLLTILLSIAGAVLTILHDETGTPMLIAALAVTTVFVVLVLHEVFTSNKIGVAEKLMWTLGMLFFNSVTGIIYLLAGRKKVVAAALPEL